MNIIDLECLVNPCYTIKIPERKINKIYSVDPKELDYYKKRIFQLTKEMLLGKRINNKINDAFHNFSRICIEYFKFADKKDMIQQDYKDLKIVKKKEKKKNFCLERVNGKMFKPDPKYEDISTFLKIKKPPKKIFFPRDRINKKNLISKYEADKKKKKEKKENKKKKKQKKTFVKVEI